MGRNVPYETRFGDHFQTTALLFKITVCIRGVLRVFAAARGFLQQLGSPPPGKTGPETTKNEKNKAIFGRRFFANSRGGPMGHI